MVVAGVRGGRKHVKKHKPHFKLKEEEKKRSLLHKIMIKPIEVCAVKCQNL